MACPEISVQNMGKVKKSTSIKVQIAALERRIKYLKKKHKEVKNKETSLVADGFVEDLKRKATDAELKFMSIAKAKGILLQFQCPIYIKKDGLIQRFYIADFCDLTNKIIIEVDGGYHFTEFQSVLDQMRTAELKRHGYRVYRITNEEVFNGQSTRLLYEIYKKIGINILSKNKRKGVASRQLQSP